MDSYLFTTERLGFSHWTLDDLPYLVAMNTDPDVMRFFPKVLSEKESKQLLDRLILMYETKGYTYYKVQEKHNGQFIGFIGMLWQTYEAPFTPCVDIGWRLCKEAWGKGYATEGAKKCLSKALNELDIPAVYSVASKANQASISVMEKIGLRVENTFKHPLLSEYPELEECVVYVIRTA